jgi:hypothetical protein
MPYLENINLDWYSWSFMGLPRGVLFVKHWHYTTQKNRQICRLLSSNLKYPMALHHPGGLIKRLPGNLPAGQPCERLCHAAN